MFELFLPPSFIRYEQIMESESSCVYFFMLAGLQIHNGAALCALVALCEMLNDVD